MTVWANPDSVSRAINHWTDRQIHCRSYGHNWSARTVFHRPGVYTIVQHCPRCTTERERDMTERGEVMGSWRMRYQRGYLLAGLGRVGSDGRNLLRLASLRGLQIEEVSDN